MFKMIKHNSSTSFLIHRAKDTRAMFLSPVGAFVGSSD